MGWHFFFSIIFVSLRFDGMSSIFNVQRNFFIKSKQGKFFFKQDFIPFLCSQVLTLYNAILRIARNFLETRENIKILTHLFYHINLGGFSWEWSKKKKKKKKFKKKFKMAASKKAHFLKSPILNIFSWKFNALILG